MHPYSDVLDSTRSLGAAERSIETGKKPYDKVVLVEADKIASLVESYPNYFGDVSLFARNLKSLCDGQEAVEFTMQPQELAPQKPWEQPDLSWFTEHRRRDWLNGPGGKRNKRR